MTLADSLRRLPKAELHLHLDGSMRLDTAVELAQAVGMPLSRDEARRRMVGPPRCRDQAELLGFFDLPIELLQTADALARVARELVEDLVADGVRYAEIRWAPRLHLVGGLSVRAVIDAVAAGVRDGIGRATGTEPPVVALIVTAMRQHPPAANVALARVAGEFGWPVVGFDLAGPEAVWPAPPHAAAFIAAAEAGLALTAHAGEVAGAQRIVEALDLGASRVAHGVTAADDEGVMALLREDGVTLDTCPTSNVQAGIVAGLERHPVARLHRAGVSVTISTDDRTVSGTTLSDELAAAAHALGLGDQEMCAIALNAFGRAFAPRAMVEPIATAASRAWEEWRTSRLTG